MDVTFANKKLEKVTSDYRKMKAVLGQNRAEKLRLRLADLSDAKNLEDVRTLSGNYHELTGKRKGQWACDLDQPYRLIFTPHEDPIPTDSNGCYIWVEIMGVEIIEIVDYH